MVFAFKSWSHQNLMFKICFAVSIEEFSKFLPSGLYGKKSSYPWLWQCSGSRISHLHTTKGDVRLNLYFLLCQVGSGNTANRELVQMSLS